MTQTEAKAASEKSRRKLEDDLKKMRDAQSVLQAERTSLSDAVAKRDQDVSRTAAEVPQQGPDASPVTRPPSADS